jgi:glycosyltransferase involved in cell wall biosynthesis
MLRPLSVRAALGLFSPAPRSYVMSWSREMNALVSDQAGRRKFDAAIAFGLRNAAYLKPLRGMLRVVDNENIDTAFAARLAEAAPSSFVKFRRKLSWVKSRMHESRIAGLLDAALVVSEEDKQALARIAPALAAGEAIHVVPNGADLGLLDYRGPEVDRRRIIFPGALTYSANYDSAVYFCDQALPLIRARIPDAKMIITGSAEGVDLAPFRDAARVTLTGFLYDVRPAIAESAVVVVPTRVGGGTRLKILEAMALGAPVVSTSFGAAGLGAKHGIHLLIGDTPEDLASQVCTLMNDWDMRNRIARSAREFVAARYGWESITQSLNRILESLVMSREGAGKCATV